MVVDNDIQPDANAVSTRTKGAWTKPSTRMTTNRKPGPDEVITIPSRMDRQSDDADETEAVVPPPAREATEDEAPSQRGPSNWKPIKRD